MNTRKFTRVKASATAAIEYNDQTIPGEILEISLQGLFIKTAAKIPVNQSVRVNAHYLKKTFHFPATVIYERDHGVGLKIDEIDIFSFLQLREFIVSKIQDPDAAIRETIIMAKIIIG